MGQAVPDRRSVALGVWLRVGSRDEEPGFEGMVHFIEHMVFKGTRTRSAPEIAASLERGGGSLEAFTTKDTTCFYARVLEDQIDLAVDVIGDLVSNPLFASADLDVERKVVVEELRNVEDSPEEHIGDLAQFHLWPGDIMGASILGTRDSLDRFDAERVAEFHRREYRASRVVVSAAGAVDGDRLEELCRQHLDLSAEPPVDRRRTPDPSLSTLAVHSCDLSQLHLILMTAAPPINDPRRKAVQLLAEIYGGGMSSRLFQSIRERDGLAYAVQAYTEHFEDVGMFGTSLAVSPERGKEALARTVEEMQRLSRDGLRDGELEGAKAQVRGSLIMGMESLTGRMNRLAHIEFRRGAYKPIEQTIAEFEAVTESDVVAAAREVLGPERQSLVAMGPVRAEEMQFKTFSRVLAVEGD